MLKLITGSVLVEAMISVALAAVVSLSLINLQSKILKTTSTINQYAQANTLAKSELEQERNYLNNSAYQLISNDSDLHTGINTAYTKSVTVTEFLNPSYKKITVDVSWLGNDGTTKSLTFNSHIGKLSVYNAGKAMEANVITPPLQPTNANYSP